MATRSISIGNSLRFRDTSLLSCSHSFCVARLQSWWRRREVFKCPVCNLISGRRNPPRNLALKNLCEAFLLEKEKNPEELCSLHGEKLKLFCLEYQEPICLICRDSERHVEHRFRPVDEAAQERRGELEASLKPLEDELERFKQVQEKYERTGKHIRMQTQKVKQGKREVIKRRMRGLKRRITTLSETITRTREELRAEDISFLRRYGTTAARVQLMNDPLPPSGLLLDNTKHRGNLTFNVWKKMNDLYFPVILDPNTAHPGLRLSKDLTSLKWGEITELPDNPERFDSSAVVLGYEGFLHPGSTAGRSRGARASTGCGAWHQSQFKEKDALAFHKHSVFFPPVRKRLQKIRIHLNCDAGVLRFSDPDMLIHSFRCRSPEALFPFISTTDKYLLKIQPDTICILNNSVCDDPDTSDVTEDLIHDGDEQIASLFNDDDD